MPRPRKNRMIERPPSVKGFKPLGVPLRATSSLRLTFEEYESIRLVGYLMLEHGQAAEQMNISRPTFTRVYNAALKTISQAFVEGKAILIEGGNYELGNGWHGCRRCGRMVKSAVVQAKCDNCDDEQTTSTVGDDEQQHTETQ